MLSQFKVLASYLFHLQYSVVQKPLWLLNSQVICEIRTELGHVQREIMLAMKSHTNVSGMLILLANMEGPLDVHVDINDNVSKIIIVVLQSQKI